MFFANAPAAAALSDTVTEGVTLVQRESGKNMVVLDRLSYRYRPNLAPVLHEVSLRLAAGSFHFLTGPSGAGKTTLLRLLQMDLLPNGSIGGGKKSQQVAGDGGTLAVFGEDVARAGRELRARLRQRIGLVFQDFRLLDHLTVQENVALPLWLAGTPEPLQLRAVTDMLTWVGLSEKLDVPAAQLSGGEKQRVALARAVVHRPDLVIADEPTGSVDAPMGRRIMHLLAELNRQGTTVVVATHDATLWQTYDHPVLRLEAGYLQVPGQLKKARVA